VQEKDNNPLFFKSNSTPPYTGMSLFLYLFCSPVGLKFDLFFYCGTDGVNLSRLYILYGSCILYRKWEEAAKFQ